ncbi:unnamed protein product, partial [marine sediment metagenome]
VLNALAGEFIVASLDLLKPFGRFLEIGKRDIYADTKLGLYPFRNNLSYFGVDLGQFGSHRKEDMLHMFENLMQRFATGELRPSPTKVFSLKDIGKGFEYMARAQHIGKIVFTVDQNLEAADTELDRFHSRFGNGITVPDGLEVFRRLVSSDETPPCIMVVADSLAASDSTVRHQSSVTFTRPVDTLYREPCDSNEEALKQIWEKTLGVSPIGVDDDFFELGGDSINAIMLQAAAEQSLNLNLSLASLFGNPTIAKMAKLL